MQLEVNIEKLKEKITNVIDTAVGAVYNAFIDPSPTVEHYNRESLPECKDIIDGVLRGYSEFLNETQCYYLGNVIKYIYRAPLKGKIDDLVKAKEYLEWIVES